MLIGGEKISRLSDSEIESEMLPVLPVTPVAGPQENNKTHSAINVATNRNIPRCFSFIRRSLQNQSYLLKAADAASIADNNTKTNN
jgi:hypothetical protein